MINSEDTLIQVLILVAPLLQCFFGFVYFPNRPQKERLSYYANPS